MNECPNYPFDSCAFHNEEGSVCWNMEERADDDYCTCEAEGEMPVCPVTICPEGFYERDSCGCEAFDTEPEEPILNFVCDPCEDGTVPAFPDCLCTTEVTVCNVCWDGSIPDIRDHPDCACPQRLVDPDEDTKADGTPL